MEPGRPARGGFEMPVNGYDRTPENGITDYTLYRSNGEVLAVIEAKRTKRDARVGKEQLRQYLDKIAAKLPPLHLQQQFASIVAQTEALRLRQRAHADELEALFQGLLQRYFGAAG